jgi:alkylation response protein AidB-like acyl-CoA dehydrogenase
MLKAVEKHPADVGGWQTKVMGLVLHAAFTLTEDLAKRDPVAARAFCVEVLGLPEWMLKMMRFGD